VPEGSGEFVVIERDEFTSSENVLLEETEALSVTVIEMLLKLPALLGVPRSVTESPEGGDRLRPGGRWSADQV